MNGRLHLIINILLTPVYDIANAMRYAQSDKRLELVTQCLEIIVTCFFIQNTIVSVAEQPDQSISLSNTRGQIFS